MLDPDDVAAAARRIGAKMLADQAVPLMLSLTGCSGDPENVTSGDLKRLCADDNVAVVLVARGIGKRKLLEWLAATTSRATFEVEPVDGPKMHDEFCNCEHCR